MKQHIRTNPFLVIDLSEKRSSRHCVGSRFSARHTNCRYNELDYQSLSNTDDWFNHMLCRGGDTYGRLETGGVGIIESNPSSGPLS